MGAQLKKAVILGLGNSLHDYSKKDNEITFGVNDVNKYFETDYLIVIDGKARFTNDRLRHIEKTNSILVSQLPEWIKGIKQFELISFKPFSILNMESKFICYSNNSTFVATTFAYNKGFINFDIYGVDLIGHKNLDTGLNRTKFINDWRNLITFIISNGGTVNLYCGLKDLLK